MSDKGREVVKYKLVSVLDFLKVPQERREDCLSEFLCWLEVAEQVSKIRASIGTEAFDWIDDGKGEMTIIIRWSIVRQKKEPEKKEEL